MSELSSQEAAVGRHYDETIFAFEAERLVRHCPVEYAITTRSLQRYIPDGAVVTEAGVGVGHYSEFLARRSCRSTPACSVLRTANTATSQYPAQPRAGAGGRTDQQDRESGSPGCGQLHERARTLQ
jgi:hypothetical protein